MSELLSHAFGDYVIQSDWMATEKTRRHGPAAAHALTYAACFLPVTRDWRALAVIGGTHFAIDRWRLARYVCWAKNQAAPETYRYPWRDGKATGYDVLTKPDWMAVWLMIVADNTLHVTINRWALRRWRTLP